jgi:gliding motility-associated-like protein
VKKTLLILILAFAAMSGYSNHIKGGFFTYKYLGPGTVDPTKLKYQVTLTVYMGCESETNPGQLTPNINFTFFDGTTKAQVLNAPVSISPGYRLSKIVDDECISGNQVKCYYFIVVYNLASVELPSLPGGLIVSYQRCCRISGIINIDNSVNIGNTYSVHIPPIRSSFTIKENNSAEFQVNDTVVVCGGSFFRYAFTASDSDGDSLSYSLCEAWSGGGPGNSPPNGPNTATPDPAAPPTTVSPLSYPVVPYTSGFSGSNPLGSGVVIDPRTGVISGVAPGISGEYVITVCVDEWRSPQPGQPKQRVGGNRKELHISVGSCTPIAANLNPEYITCDGFTMTFSNEGNNSGIQNYFWDFGVGGQTSNSPTPTFTYPDTGVYKLTLTVNQGMACSGTANALVKVFPGFFPGFTHAGICINKPTQFTDTTRTAYGTVNTWNWDFGVTSSTTDVSTLRNPQYTYTTTGTRNVRFIVTNSKGCIDTVYKDITILDKPPISVAFDDTLICRGDAVQLEAIGNGTFSWTPLGNISNPNTATPTVTPASTTRYFVQLNDNGCINTDTVDVRVVNFVTLSVMPDTVICSTDTIQLRTSGDGLSYAWTPSALVFNPAARSPLTVPPTGSTAYTVTSSIGGCSTSRTINVLAVDYPDSDAGPDTLICFNTPALLNGTAVGNSFAWSPAGSLSNPNSLTPTATPAGTTTYYLSVWDTRGCPKPGIDSVKVTVLPKMNASAGRDTAVVVGQPLQLLATGGINYLWTPSTGLNNPNIDDPVGTYDGNIEYIIYTVFVQDEAGCEDTASVQVRVFKTDPKIFVPTAFTPNGDGKNDRFNFVAVGINKVDFFRVYNRWGQLVYSSGINSYGWDGKIGGKEQPTGTFVWVVQGSDFTGKKVFAKGTVTLIR